MRSCLIVTVHDLLRKIHAVIDERQQTKANETEKETTPRTATDCAHTRIPLPPQSRRDTRNPAASQP
jgi:hypothetical protein